MPAKKQSKTPLIIGTAIVALIIVVAIIWLAPKQPLQHTSTIIAAVPKTSNELLYNDLLSQPFVSSNITVLGISVGMTEDDVTKTLGPADTTNDFDFGGIKNWQYAEKLGLNQTGVIYHMEKGVVTRIVVTNAMDQYLQGQSKVSKSKAEIYSTFGIPDRQYDVSKFRYFVYNKQGFESYFSDTGEYQYAFVYPNRKLPTMAYIPQNITNGQVLQQSIPILLTDTTTLCNQGPTFGEDLSSKECKQFNNSCGIPADWVEVTDCSANSTIVQR